MKDKVILVEMLFEKLEEFGKTNIELYRLKAIDRSTDVFAAIATKLVVFTIITLFLLLITIGFSLYLGEVLGKVYYGFFAMAGIYLVLCIIFLIFKKPIEDFFNNYLIRQIFKQKN